MAVGQLGRVALRLARDGLDAHLVELAVGGGGEHDFVAQIREEREPEGVVLEHVEDARQADPASRSLVAVLRNVAEDPVVLVLIEVGQVVFIFLLAEPSLAAVAGDVAGPVAELVDREPAVVGAEPAAGHGGRVGEVIDRLDREHVGLRAVAAALLCDQGRAERTHDAGDVRADDLALRDPLEASKNRVIVKCPALDDDILSELACVGDLYDLVEGIFDDRISQACGDVRNGRALLLGLLDLGVHEDRAAGAEVDRVLGKEGRLREILDRIVQGFCEVLDEGAAARGAGLVQHDIVDGVVLDADAFHVLAADVEDAVHIRVEELSCIIVGDRLDLSLVKLQGGLDQGLTVAGGAGACNVDILRHVRVDLLDRIDRGLQRVAVVGAVGGVEQCAVLRDEGGLGGRRAGVHAEVSPAFVFRKVALFDLIAVLAGSELRISLLILKERLEAGDFELHLDPVVQLVLESL